MSDDAGIAQILLVRAVEECDPDALPPRALGDAAVEAGELDEPTAWLGRRAAVLLTRIPAAYAALPAVLDRSARWGLVVAVALALVTGIAANYLGPSDRIHVVWNPILLLVAWNLALYVALAFRWSWPRIARRRRTAAPVDDPSPPAAGPAWWLVEHALPRVAAARERLERGRRVTGERLVAARTLADVARRFLVLWHDATGQILGVRLRRALHLCAIALATGALLGTYVRGVFFEYNVVWRSTFVRDDVTVRFLLDVLLGPAALLTGHGGFDGVDVPALLGPTGLPAAPWIHLLAVTAAIWVLVPRAVLALVATARIRRAGRHARLDLDDPYHQRLLGLGQAAQLEPIAERLALHVRIACARLAESVAVFVRDELYDRRVVPLLHAYRTEGGSLGGLETRLAATCRDFEPALEAFVGRAHDAFERELAADVERVLGTRLALPDGFDAGWRDELVALPRHATGDATDTLGGELSDAIDVSVSTAVALAVGAVSGGIGHHLGIAVVTALLGTTGPVGFVIGALGAFAVTSIGFQLSREAIAEQTKRVPLPATALQLLLHRRKLERLVAQGRAQAYASVKTRLDAELARATPPLMEQLRLGLRPVLRRLAAERAAVRR